MTENGKPTSRQEAADMVLAGLQFLILDGRMLLGVEQYHPGQNPDASDAAIKDYRARVKSLRSMREHFETLMTGGID